MALRQNSWSLTALEVVNFFEANPEPKSLTKLHRVWPHKLIPNIDRTIRGMERRGLLIKTFGSTAQQNTYHLADGARGRLRKRLRDKAAQAIIECLKRNGGQMTFPDLAAEMAKIPVRKNYLYSLIQCMYDIGEVEIQRHLKYRVIKLLVNESKFKTVYL